MIEFSFENENLGNIIQKFAAKKQINIVFPAEPITQTITFNPKAQHKISLSDAEDFLNMFLRLSGYALYPDGDHLVLTKLDNTVTRVPLPLYVNVKPDELPFGKEIRAIYYLANLRVPDTNQGLDPLTVILRDMLSINGTFLFDQKSNGIIIADQADNISSAMTIILELDTAGLKDSVEIIQLYNSSARTIAQLLKEQIVATAADPRGAIRTDIKTDSSLFFAPNTRIVSIDHLNSLVLMGKQTSVDRLKEFIQEYMDAPQESGNSILHSYDLQYLDADQAARVLQSVVSMPAGVTNGQSQKENTGPYQFFDGVKIVAETYQAAEAAKTIAGTQQGAEETGTVYFGGNRLIIAAKQKDWERIKQLIQQLDKPEWQVIIEIMILDVTLDEGRIIAGQTRNPAGAALPPGIEFQAAHIIGPVLDNTEVTPPNATTLAADLLRILLGSPTDSSLAFRESIGVNNGSLIFAINDPSGSGIWSVIQILQRQVQTKFLSHPYLVTLNNTKAEEVVNIIKQGRGNQSIGEGAVSTIKQQDFEAKLKVAVTPRVSSSTRVNLQIAIDIEAFTDPDNNVSFTRITRKVGTSANLNSGEVIAFGGLGRVQENDSDGQTPILGQIPIFGWLFRSNQKRITHNNLCVLISPTIVGPTARTGQAIFTEGKIARGYSDMPNFLPADAYKDPITRWFFRANTTEDQQAMDRYLINARRTNSDEIIEPAVDPEDQQLQDLLINEGNPLNDVRAFPVMDNITKIPSGS
jgi:general secretion pathway protein D